MQTGSSWPCLPKAEAFLYQLYDEFCARNDTAAKMADRLRREAGVSLFHLADHWSIPDNGGLSLRLTEAGFEKMETGEGDEYWAAPGVRLAPVRVTGANERVLLAISVESVSNFVEAWNLPSGGTLGDTDSRYQELRFELENGSLAAVFRRGYTGFRPTDFSAGELRRIEQIRMLLRERPRQEEARQCIASVRALLAEASAEIGRARTVDEFFAAERVYYTARNCAARHQLDAQNRLGVGWANQDHHTYRCSRTAFRDLLALWIELGFEPRERYYAGDDAGWGAQILEHPESRVVLFCDVDVAPDEIDIDFTAVPLDERIQLGTIGLWCGLHGDSVAAAGMHHLECEFDFEAACSALCTGGYEVMKPFTDMPILKQAFTVGETWHPSSKRVEALAAAGSITREQADKFLTQGATGSHLEILQRWEGFKGFNKTGVSAIIRETDARGLGKQH